ncbi:hypothetical protein BGW38_001834, partial [Lunasporangiospora selenospora]
DLKPLAMSTSSMASAQLIQRMQEKKQELEHLLLLRQLSNHLQTHFDELSEKFDGLVQGNQGIKRIQQYHHPQLYMKLDLQASLKFSFI